MLARLKCWWSGHVIKAEIVKNPIKATYAYIYHCERCKRVLPGPR